MRGKYSSWENSPFIFIGLGIFFLCITGFVLLDAQYKWLVIASLLIAEHVVYIGYLFAKMEAKQDSLSRIAGIICLLATVLLFKTLSNPIHWFSNLCALFIIGILYHHYNISLPNKEHVKKIFIYKKQIDILGLILSCIGLGLTLLFPAQITLISILTLLAIIKINIMMFIKKSLRFTTA